MLSRHDAAIKLGERVSRGRHERILNLLFNHKSRVQSTSRGKQTGAVRTTCVLHPLCPKAVRKYPASNYLADERKTKRARYVFK
jgi:hypothetical protein